MKESEVVAAIIENNNEVLCMERGQGKFEYVSFKYEFPGGKIEAGEEAAQALQRELNEEMDLDIDAQNMTFFYTVNHEYPDFKIKLHTFICRVKTRKFTMKEHVNFKWLPKNQLKTLEWAEADWPIVEELAKGC